MKNDNNSAITTIKIFLTSSLFILLTACGGGGGGGSPDPDPDPNTGNLTAPAIGAALTSISVTPSNATLKVGNTLQMVAIGNYDDGGQANLTGSVIWASVGGGASINGNGLATAVSPGSSLITAIHSSSATQGATSLYTSTYGVEGSVSSPVPLTIDSAYSGEVNAGSPSTGDGYSYYAVNVTPGAAYYVFLTGLDANAHLEVYDDSNFSNAICTSEEFGTTDEVCFAEGPANGVLYIAVNGDDTYFSTAQGASYNLIVRAGFKDEGNGTNPPVNLTLNSTYNGQTGRYLLNSGQYGTSIYTASIAATGRYTITITNPSEDVSFMVLDPFSVVECSSDNAGLADESCSFQAEDVPVRILVSSPNDSVIGASYDVTITEDHGAYSTEGTSSTPVNLTAFPYSGEVGGISGWTESFYSVAVTPTQSWRVQATNLDGGVTMRVYDGDATFTTPVCSPYSGAGTDMECLIEPASSSMLYIKMTTSGLGTAYQLNVSPINYPAQGTALAPQALTQAPTWDAVYSGSVDSSSSYYEVSVTSGSLYQIGAANVSGDISLSVYGDANLTNLLCSSNNAGLADESCQATPVSSSLWVVVGGDTYGSKFDLSVDRVYVQQGTNASPLDITGSLPTYSGETASALGNAESTHMSVSLIAGKAYQFEVSNNTDEDLELYVYDNTGFSYPYVCSGRATAANTAFSCTVNPLYSGTAYIIVLSRKPFGSAFDFTVSEIAFNTEGSIGSPASIGAFPVVGTVGTSRLEYAGGTVDGTDSYYVADISGGYDYVNYTVELLNQSADVDLYVYDDAGFSNLLCSSVAAGTGAELCAGLSTASNNLYIRVSGASSGFGGVFELYVDHDYTVEGALSTGNGGGLTYNAIPLTSGVSYQGQADTLDSSYYYLPASLSTPGSYTVTVANMFDSACAHVYGDPDGKITTFSVYPGTNKAITPDKTYTGTFNDGVFVKINACGSTVTGTAYDITITAN